MEKSHDIATLPNRTGFHRAQAPIISIDIAHG
jgi:hypothetical protein